ncbi:2466_t:CDS:2, partial [Cetraspora pellucida]
MFLQLATVQALKIPGSISVEDTETVVQDELTQILTPQSQSYPNLFIGLKCSTETSNITSLIEVNQISSNIFVEEDIETKNYQKYSTETSDITSLMNTSYAEPIDIDLIKEPEIDKVYQKIQDELTQSLIPQPQSHPNPFIDGTWKDQLKKILNKLKDKDCVLKKQIKTIEAYL